MSIFCSFWTGLFHRKRGLWNPTGQSDLNTEDANITSPQDQADTRFSGITGSPSLVRTPVSKSRHGALQAKSVSNVRALDTGSKSSGKQKSYFNMGLGGTSSDVVREAEAIFQLAVPLTVEANEGMNLSFETENGVLVTEKYTELDSKESKPETFSASDLEPSKDADCLLVTNSGLLENRDACGDLTSEFPGTAPKDGTMDSVALSTVNSGFPLYLDDTHLHLPVLEGFIMQVDDGEPSISFDKLNQMKSVIEQASILEELCKSSCMQNLVSSEPTGFLKGMDEKNKLPISDAVKKINDNYGCLSEKRKQLHLDQQAADRANFIQMVKEKEKELMYKRYEMEREAARMMEEEKALEQLRRTLVPQARPVPKFDRLPIRHSPISRVWANLPCIAEGNENAEEITKDNLPEVGTSTLKREPKKMLGNPKSSKTNNNEKQSLAVGASGVKWAKSIYNRSNEPKLTGKSSLRGGPSSSEIEPKHNNTVSCITFFIPLFQQKQAAAALPVKMDIELKALKAVEEENEWKTKKQSPKIERARKEKENMRQLELQKKKKEEDHKKKEAFVIAKKKQWEEKENKEKERIKMCSEEERKQHREYEQKFGAEKQEKDRKLRTTLFESLIYNARGHEMKDSKDERGKHKMDEEKGHSL